MTTPSQSSSSNPAASVAQHAPYAGPERRIADRGRPVETSGGNGAHHELGPYLPDRRRSRARNTPAQARMAVESATRVESEPQVAFAASEPLAVAEDVMQFSNESASTISRSSDLPWITSFLDEVPERVIEEVETVAESVVADAVTQESPAMVSAEYDPIAADFELHVEDPQVDAVSETIGDEEHDLEFAIENFTANFDEDVVEFVAESVASNAADSVAAHDLSATDTAELDYDLANAFATYPAEVEVTSASVDFLSALSGDAASEDAASKPEPDEAWPLDDAGIRLRTLAFALDEHTPNDEPEAREAITASDAPDDADLTRDAVAETPLPMWSDDDFMDVMPVHAASVEAMLRASDAREVADSEWNSRAFETGDVTMNSFDVSEFEARQRERQEASVRDAAEREAAASALESVAHRVRAGEISLAGFDAALGEAAALATTLAAMLSGGR